MMYEELAKSLRAQADYCCCYIGLNSPPTMMFIKAADAIEDLSQALDTAEGVLAEQPPVWIPVTERLPECDLGAEVGNIEWISCGMVHAGCFGRGGKYRDAYFRTWTDAGEGMDAKDADYWRAVTLPQPPKDGET